MKKLVIFLALTAAAPAVAQPAYNTVETYLSRETGYPPAQLAPAPQAQAESSQQYAAFYPRNESDDEAVYRGNDVGPSASDSSLRNLLTAAGN